MIVLTFIFRLQNNNALSTISEIVPSIRLLSIKRSPADPRSPISVPDTVMAVIANCG